MRERIPTQLAAFFADPVAHHLPGGEDPQDCAARGVEVTEEIANTMPTGRILVVAHTTLIRLVLCQFIGAPLSAYRRLFPQLGNVALNEIRLIDGQFSLLQLNAVPLPS